MGDEIPHVCVVYGLVRLGFPRIERGFIIGKHANDVDVIDILERILGWIDEFATKDEVKTLGHWTPMGKISLARP